MKKWIFTGLFLTSAVCFFISVETKAGLFSSKSKSGKSINLNKGKLLLSVDFEPNVPLKYSFVCERKISLNLDPSGRHSKGGRGQSSNQNTAEKLEMEIVYKPIKIDPYGYSTIEATCNSAKVTRTSGGKRGQDRRDAVEFLVGKSFTLEITPTGKITDYNSLRSLTKELGEKAFADSQQRGRIKDPDMIMDFVATQWRIWDSTASVKKPLKGVKKESKWNSQLLAPMPFPFKTGRDVVYKLAGIAESNNVSCADITSTYSLSKLPLADAPWPYLAKFQMRGTFGFLQNLKVLSLVGTGRQLFDIKRGLIKSDTQRYQAKVSASVFSLASTDIAIDQTITMTLVE
jgi:hypothetical protein